MTFRTIPFNVVGGTHENRSRPVSVQKTVNLYPQVNTYSDNQTSLQSFYGQELLNGDLSGKDRGMHEMSGIAYTVVGESLYSFDASGISTFIGNVFGASRCIFANDGSNLVIVADRVYLWDSFNGIFGAITNDNLVNVLSVTVINSQFIYTTPRLSFMSAPGEPDNVSGLDGIGAESSPDKLVRDYVFNQTIYRFGERTTEPWYNSGAGSPPIDRIDGQELNVGLGAIYSVANTDNAVYWLGDDKSVYRISGNIKEKVSDDALSNEIEGFSRIDNAFGYSFSLQGQDFYLITFPDANKTYVINEQLGSQGWFNLSSADGAYSGKALIQAYNKNIVSNSGKLLVLNPDVYTEDGQQIIRERITGTLNAEVLGIKGQRLKMSRLELFVEAGVGLITGQGERPRLLIETSIDGGRSYSHSAWVEIGQLGEHTLRCELWNMMSGESFVFRITMSDPVPLTIKGGAIDVKMVGR
ncbi:MAG: hypothetical protein ACPGUE_12070 [Marinomonas sp.]